MNIFAGNFTLNGNRKIDLDFDFVESISKTGDKIVFVFGETEVKTSKELLEYISSSVGEMKTYDLSISSEEKVEIINLAYEDGIYELATFEGEEVSFDEIYDRFKDFEEVVSIREVEISDRFGNKKIRVDFVY
ncbi:MAG: hypothetical protein PHH06_02730 [Candidatus Gracilibacteria bacterium]|nr:hypothetical protein [Candidatus Gracilibacteria bacterium]